MTNFLNDKLCSIRRSIHQVTTELEKLITDVNTLFDHFGQLLDELKADTLRTNAYIKNNALRNTTLPIRPIVAFHLARGILEPDPDRFARHANAFSAFRTPSTPNQHSMLAYLVSLYDISITDPTTFPDGDDDPEFIIIRDPDTAVDQLESILGLNEDNFTRFRYRAAEMVPAPRARRSRFADENQHTFRMKPYKDESPESDHSDAHASTRLGWGSRSTPSSQRPSANPEPRRQARELARAQERARMSYQSSDDDALTSANPNISPREPHRIPK